MTDSPKAADVPSASTDEVRVWDTALARKPAVDGLREALEKIADWPNSGGTATTISGIARAALAAPAPEVNLATGELANQETDPAYFRKAAPAPARREARHALVSGQADEIVSRVVEWDDRTSPEDFPEALLITPSELHRELMRFAEDIGALALSPQDRAPGDCPNGLHHGSCGYPNCVSSCPGRIPLATPPVADRTAVIEECAKVAETLDTVGYKCVRGHDRCEYGADSECPYCEHRSPIAAAIRSLAPKGDGPATGWQPIETAPRDGTRILARGGALDDIEVVAYSPNVGAWATPHYTLDDRDDEPDGYNRPRFWMPLPAVEPLGATVTRAERSPE